MEKTCANHPESMALASCKACEKSICLMCVLDEKEGTFCSEQCHKIFTEVAGWTDAPAGSSAAAAAAGPEAPPAAPEPAAPAAVETPSPAMPERQESIFEIEPEAPPAGDPEPLVAPGTKWRMIGAMCVAHADTPAVATCDGCDKTLCALCLTETTNGTFCNACVARNHPGAEVKVLSQAATAAAARKAGAPAGTVPGRVTAPSRKWRRGSSPAVKVAAGIIIVGVAAAAYYFYTESQKLQPNPAPPVAVQPPAVTPTPPKPPPPTPVPPPPTPPPPTPTPQPPKPAPPEPPKPVPPKPVPPPEPPKPNPNPNPAPPEPPREPIVLGRVTHPWAREAAGTWFRFRLSGAGPDVYVDQGLKEKDAYSYVLHIQKLRKGDAAPEAAAEKRFDLTPYQVKTEEPLQIEDRKLLCEIREEKVAGIATQTWVLIEGIHAGAVLKKTAGEKVLYLAKRFWDHTLRIGSRRLDCLVIEGERAGDVGLLPVKTWYSTGVPGGVVREETFDGSLTLVDAGEDWAARPPFPK
jgi:hypothetical protein